MKCRIPLAYNGENNMTKVCTILSGLFLALFGVALYYAIIGDVETCRSFAHVSIPFGYAGLLWEAGIRLHKACPLRSLRDGRNGPTFLR